MLLRLGRLRAVGHAANQRADLADDLGVVDRQRGVGLGVLGVELQGLVQALAHLAGQPCFKALTMLMRWL